jgi:hypothetical protein
MKKIAATCILLILPASAVADEDCYTAPLGPYRAQIPVWSLAMMPPESKTTILLSTPVPVSKGLVIAKEEYSIKPVTRYLAADIVLSDENGKSLANAVPLQRGAPITQWLGSDDDRYCTIGWKNGLFGGATGEGHYRWICLEDRNKDERFDNAWRPKSGNMGLSFSRFDMPITPAVGWTETIPADIANAKAGGGPLESYPASRSIEVNKLSGKSVQLWYWGAGIGRKKENRIELALDKPGTVTLGGFTIKLEPTSKGKANISATGSFQPQKISKTCDEGGYQIGEFDSRVVFSFPDW